MLNTRGVWLVGGIVLGTIFGLSMAGLWPQVPVHAVATHGQDSFAIATGPVDADVEAVFVLDNLTGELRGAVLNNQLKRFNSHYKYNVAADFEKVKNPHYLMVTGMLRPVGVDVGSSVVYIAELTSGQLNAYGVPYSSAAAANGVTQKYSFQLFDRTKFRTVVVR